MSGACNKSELFASLPAPWPEDLLPGIRAAVAASPRKLVVLDDDPTGTQTVYNLPVLTTWDLASLRAEFTNDAPCFYILTNSRSLPAEAAYALNLEIARNLQAAAAETGVGFSIVSRSDSTLRGHFPGEVLALSEALGGFDAVVLIPCFEAGGRYTIGDVHYVAEGDTLVPAAETPFAQDAAFGYRASNLRAWVAEKFRGAVAAAAVATISIEELRIGGPKVVGERLLEMVSGNLCVVNAAGARDLEVLVQGLLAAEAQGRKFLFRTAASFVAARLGLAPQELWQPLTRPSANLSPSDAERFHEPTRLAICSPEPGRNADLPIGLFRRPDKIEPLRRSALRFMGRDGVRGGLTIVGSYVPKTTAQLDSLLRDDSLERVEITVEAILEAAKRAGELTRAISQTNAALRAGRDVVVCTSRKLVAGADAAASLAIGNQVSDALVELLQSITVKPRYLIAKGGITASDLATRGLGVKRALVLGQILPGVPVWELGTETKFPGLPYVVFPGNVGGPEALAEAVNKFTP